MGFSRQEYWSRLPFSSPVGGTQFCQDHQWPICSDIHFLFSSWWPQNILGAILTIFSFLKQSPFLVSIEILLSWVFSDLTDPASLVSLAVSFSSTQTQNVPESLDLNLLCISKSFLLGGLLWFHVFKCNVYNDVSDICIFSLSLSFEFYTYKSNCLLDIATCIHSKLSKSRKVPWVPIFQVLNIISTTKSCQSTSYKYFAVSIAMLSHGLRHLSTGLVQLPPDWFFFQFILPIAAASLLSTYLSMYHAILALALSSLVFSYYTVLLIHHAVVMMLFFLPLEHTVLLYTSRIFHILPPLPGMVIYVSSLMAFIIGQASSKCFSWINTLNSHITHTR